jgi:hypothetical protein
MSRPLQSKLAPVEEAQDREDWAVMVDLEAVVVLDGGVTNFVGAPVGLNISLRNVQIDHNYNTLKLSFVLLVYIQLSSVQTVYTLHTVCVVPLCR